MLGCVCCVRGRRDGREGSCKGREEAGGGRCQRVDGAASSCASPSPLIVLPLQSTKPEEASRMYDRHFDHKDELVSRIT